MNKKRAIIMILAVIYLYASYQIKVVNYSNANDLDSGISDYEVILGGLLVLCYMLSEMYFKLKYKIILKKKMRRL